MATVLTPDQLQTIRGRGPVKGSMKVKSSSYSHAGEIEVVTQGGSGPVRVVGIPRSDERMFKSLYRRAADLLAKKATISDESQKPLVPTKVSDEEYDEILAERLAQYELIRHGE